MNKGEALNIIYDLAKQYETADFPNDSEYYYKTCSAILGVANSDGFSKENVLKVLNNLANNQTEYGMRCGVIEAIKAIKAIEVLDD